MKKLLNLLTATILTKILALTLALILTACANDRPARPTNIIFDRPQEEITSDVRLDSADNQWDGYGEAVDVLGDVMVIGASEWNQIGPGSAYVYRLINNEWQLEANLIAGDRDSGHRGQRFGTAVALKENLIAVGAPGSDSPDLGDNSGAVYIYEYEDQSWVETAKLTPIHMKKDNDLELINRARPRVFGSFLALHGRTLAVGGGADGLIYIFEKAADGWRIQAQLAIPETRGRERRLADISLYGDTLALSAIYIPPQPEFSPTTTGSVIVHLFERTGEIWEEIDPFIPEDNRDLVFLDDVIIGASISLGGESGAAEMLAVGLPGFPDWTLSEEEIAQFWGGPEQLPDFPPSHRQTGAVYLLERTRQGWQHQATLRPAGWETPPRPGMSLTGFPPADLLAEDGSVNEAYVSELSFPGHIISENPDVTFFGSTVDLDGRQLAVTAGFANATYLFQRQEQDWVYQYSFKPIPIKVEAWEDFAQVVAINGRTLLLGTPGEFGSSAYVFTLP